MHPCRRVGGGCAGGRQRCTPLPSSDTRANAGFNSNTKSYSLPGSFTVNDTRLTCGGATGCYTFRVDGATIVAPSATRTPTQSPSSTATRTQAVTPTRSSTATFVPPVVPQPCDPIAQAFCPSERDPGSYTSITVMNGGAGVGECLLLQELYIHASPPPPPGAGGQRAADCLLEVEVCYRYDSPSAPPTRMVTWSQPDPASGAILTWSATLSNGWCQYLRLANVTRTLAYSYSDDGMTWYAVGSVAVPAATACAASLTPPVISPLGGTYLGAVSVSITTSAASAVSFYTLSGASYTAGAVAYTGPFTLCTPGNTTVTAYSTRAGAATSVLIQSSFVLAISSHPNVTSRGCRLLGAGACLWVAPRRLTVLHVASCAGDDDDTGENPLVAVVGGRRDVACDAVLRLRYVSASNSAVTGHFRLVRSDSRAGPINADLWLPNGFDSTIAIPARVCGFGTAPIFSLQRLDSGSGWTPCRCGREADRRFFWQATTFARHCLLPPLPGTAAMRL